MPYLAAHEPFELPLLHLFNELQGQRSPHRAYSAAPAPTPTPTITPTYTYTYTPRFDVLEFPTAYELQGEIPGVLPADVAVEFTDAQTLVIKGRTTRPTISPLLPAVARPDGVDVEPETEIDTDAVSVHGSEMSNSPSNSSSSGSSINYHATVEDDYDVVDAPLSVPSTPATTPRQIHRQPQPQTPPTPSPPPFTRKQTPAHDASPAAATAAPAPAPAPATTRHWITERRVGAFARSFVFPQRIEHDATTAALADGVLRVVIPKTVRSGRVPVTVF